MIRLLLISVLVALAVARAALIRPMVSMLDERIIGGVPAEIEEFPHQVSIESQGRQICAGSIIAPNKILTAAHCTIFSIARLLSVRAGTSILESGGTVVNVTRICRHPKFNLTNIDSDVAVLVLSSNLPTTNAIQAINLPAVGSSVATGTIATVSGWGITSSGPPPEQLHKVDVPKVSQQDCKDAYDGGDSEITDTMTCYGWAKGGKDACKGDSGGALVIGRTQIGIVSWGLSCAQPKYPGVYTDTANAGIRKHIDSC